jgi:autotransporter-associated beta strand protein
MTSKTHGRRLGRALLSCSIAAMAVALSHHAAQAQVAYRVTFSGQGTNGSAIVTTNGVGSNGNIADYIKGSLTDTNVGAGTYTITGLNGSFGGPDQNLQAITPFVDNAGLSFNASNSDTYNLFGTGGSNYSILSTTGFNGGISLTVTTYASVDTNQASYDQNSTPLQQSTVVFEGGTFKPTTGVTLNAPIILSSYNGGGTIDASNGAVTLDGAITGPGGLTLSGGTLIIGGNNANTVGGTVTIDSGATMVWGTGNGQVPYLIGGSGGVTDNGALVMNFGGGGLGGTIPIVGSGRLEIETGALTLAGSSTYSGTTTVDAPGVLLLQGGQISSSSNVIVNGTFDLSLQSAPTLINTLSGSGAVDLGAQNLTITAGSTTFSGVIADGGFAGGTGGSLTIGGGTLTLTGTNTFTGGTTINNGATLALGNGTGTSGSVVGAIDDEGTLQFNYNGTVTNTNPISGGGNAELVAGTLIIGHNATNNGANNVGGVVTIDSGATMVWGTGSGLPTYLTDGTGGLTDNGALVMNFGGGGLGGTIPISGTGTLEIKTGAFTEGGNSTFTGTTTIDAAGLLLLQGGQISSSSNVIDNGIFDLSLQSAPSLIKTLSGSGSVDLGSQNLTITAGSTTFSGVIADGGIGGGTGGSLTIGGGTLTLTGNNTFTGGTTINNGATLQLGNGSGTTGSVVDGITDNGTLKFNYNGPVTTTDFISGSGNVELVGGTLIVGWNDPVHHGANIVGGTVTIDNGATMVWGTGDGHSAFLIGGSGGVVDNGALVMNFGGGGLGGTIPISGTGTLEIKSGAFTEGGNSTYSGTTTIDAAGVLLLQGGQISSSSNVIDNGTFDLSLQGGLSLIKTLSGSGAVHLGAQNLTITAGSTTFSGVIADGGVGGGAGGNLVITGGTQTLTGANTYTGGTEIFGGTLQLGDGTGTTGSVVGTIFDDSALKFDYNGPVTTTNAITGSGNVELVGGTLIVGFNVTNNGANSVGGTVTIDNGATMVWGTADGHAPYLVGGNNGVTDNGALVMNFGGGGLGGNIPISGTGTLEIKSGALTEGGNSTYTGTTTIDAAGILLLANGGQISSSSNVIDNGTFDISMQGGAPIPALGPPTLIRTLSGSGTVHLGLENLTITNGSTTFSGVIADGGIIGGTGGSLTIGGGTLTLDGVNTFTGLTTISAGTLEVGDAAHPGASLADSVVVGANGTLMGHGTIAGAVTNTSGGTVAPGGTIGTLTVGSYTQGATSTLAIEVSPTAASQLNSLGAASLNGKLALTFDAGAYGPAVFKIVAGAPVSGTFATVTATGSPGEVYGLLYTPTAVDLVLGSTAPAQVFGGTTTASLDRANAFANLVEDRFGDAGCADGTDDKSPEACHGMRAWAQAVASSNQLRSSGSAFGFTNTAGGVLGGIDQRWGSGSTLGAAFGYEDESFSMNAASSKAAGGSYFASLYGRLAAGRTWVDGQLFYMHSNWNVTRSVVGFGSAKSKPDADGRGALLQISAPIGDSDVRPFARAIYTQFNRTAFTETGVGPVGFTVAGDDPHTGLVEGGILYAHTFTDGGREWRPGLEVGVQQSFDSRASIVSASLAGVPGTGFTVNSAAEAQTSGVVDASLKMKLNARFELTGDVRGRFSGNQTDGSASLGGVFKF